MATHQEVLQQYWGYRQFRPLQEDIITSVLNGQDTLALMPTGGGKSLCFQVPALCRAGVCLVISPLIALMKDQVAQLRTKGIPAAAIYSGMPTREIDRIFDSALAGKLKFLYLSPERLQNQATLVRIRNLSVNLLAVDEAHCISQWGYDFRPSYLRIADIRATLPEVPVLALTATATEDVVRDIQQKLHFRAGKVLQKSFARQNLAYVVRPEENKWPKMLDILRKVPGSAVVYVRNRRMTAEAARYLQQHNISASYYHAGLDTEERSRRQDAWIRNETRVIVATNAFGMGIDKPDVRLVIHLDLPESLEAYFQEAGRGGRDGERAYAVLLYAPSDRIRLEEGLSASFPSLADVRQVYRALGSFLQLAQGAGYMQSFDFDLHLFCQNFRLHPWKTYAALRLLEQEGWIALTEAVQVPSVFHVSVGRETLYDFQLKHPQLDPLVKAVLRQTQGAFQDFVRLNEYQVARVLQTSAERVMAGLRYLQQEGLIQYQPAKDKPQLVFLRPRVDAEALQFDEAGYQERQVRARTRVEAAVTYATAPLCRSRQLLAYFGEQDAPDCQICDVCRASRQRTLTASSFQDYRMQIFSLLATGTCRTEKDLLGHFKDVQREQVTAAISYLLDEGYLDRQDGRLVAVPPESGAIPAPAADE